MNNFLRFVWQHYLYTVITVLTVLFALGYHYLKSTVYLTLLNGLYFGSVVSLIIVNAQWFWYALTSRAKYTRDRQYIISVALMHFSYILIVKYSLTYTVNPYNTNNLFDLLLSRYIVIIANIIQVYSPDFGETLLYGYNRKIIIAGTSLGFMTAIAIIFYKFFGLHVLPVYLENLFEI